MDSEPTPSAEWSRYGGALSVAMSEVVAEVEEDMRPLLVETAEYWLAIGLIVGVHHDDAARRLLHVIERDEKEVTELANDAASFINQALG